MADKRKDELIIAPEEFPAYLREWMRSHGYETVQDLADYLGVKRELVYMMFKGRSPSSAVREKVGLETVWRVKQPKGKK